MRLDVKSFAIAAGVVWGGGLFLLTWWIMMFEGVTHDPTAIAHLYRGYNISPLGSLIGLIWAVPDGAVFGAIFAWLYNLIADRNEAGAA